MKQGLIVASSGGPPTDFLGKRKGFIVLARAHELFSFPVTGILASDKKKLSELPKRYQGQPIYSSESQGYRKNIYEVMKIDKEMATATYDSVAKAFNEDGNLPEDGLRLVAGEAKKAHQDKPRNRIE